MHDRMRRSLVLALALATAGCGAINDLSAAASELEAAWKEAAAEGVPLIVADMKPVTVAPADNGARLIDKAVMLLNAETATAGSAGLSTLVGLPPQSPEAAAAVKRLGPCLQALREASDKAAVVRPHEYDLGPLEAFPEFASEKSLAKVVAFSARVKAAHGDFLGAGQDLAAGRRLAKIVSSEDAALISPLVGIACESIVLDAADECLSMARGNRAALATLRQEAFDGPLRPDFVRAVRWEAFLGVTTIRNLEKFGGLDCLLSFSSGTTPASGCRVTNPPDVSELNVAGQPKGQADRAYMARHLQFYTWALRELKKPGADVRTVAKEMDRKMDSVKVGKTPSHALSVVLTPTYTGFADAVVKSEAVYACESALAQVLEYEARTKAWPKDLAEAGANGRDPFDGRPLRYSVKNGTVKVWSVGPDGNDDGGLSRRETGDEGRFDIVASTPHLPPRRL